mmetsp:Transcript_6972/g.6150  ORF Transcript_6972/g.6150 Transcript_6972/m.6150 type:complete len:127 (-) Transcript_6972:2-382(-)
MDMIFDRRMTVLRINLCFQSEECREYLLEKLVSNHTLSELYINYMQSSYTQLLLEALEGVNSLNYLELQTKDSPESAAEYIDEFCLKTGHKVIVHFSNYSNPGLVRPRDNFDLNPKYPRPEKYCLI